MLILANIPNQHYSDQFATRGSSRVSVGGGAFLEQPFVMIGEIARMAVMNITVVS
jgi:hypothetical protein